MYTLRTLTGDERFRLGGRVLENLRVSDARVGPCTENCGGCDRCLRAKFLLWAQFCEPQNEVQAIENGAGPIACVIWLGNELHGHAYDGRLFSKRAAVEESIRGRLTEYPVVRMTVPANSLPIAKWATRKLGFKVAHIEERGFVHEGRTQAVYHLWRQREWAE